MRRVRERRAANQKVRYILGLCEMPLILRSILNTGRTSWDVAEHYECILNALFLW